MQAHPRHGLARRKARLQSFHRRQRVTPTLAADVGEHTGEHTHRDRARQGGEAPLIQQFNAAAAGRVGVLGVVDGAYPDTPDDALDASRGLGLHYPSLFDEHGKLVELVRASGIPMTLLVDAQGKVVFTQPGQLKAGQLAQLTKQYLGIDVGA